MDGPGAGRQRELYGPCSQADLGCNLGSATYSFVILSKPRGLSVPWLPQLKNLPHWDLGRVHVLTCDAFRTVTVVCNEF